MRQILLAFVTVVVSGLITWVVGESIVRLTVPEETFWPISNIYRRSQIPGVSYTYRYDYEGTAFGVTLKTNELGFRGAKWTKRPQANTLRIALLGDSYAFGFGVSFENTVGERLAELLESQYDTGAEVLNFGVNGYNSEQQQAVLENLALDYEPDVVVLLPTNNDHDAARVADGTGWLHWDRSANNVKSKIFDASIQKMEVKDVPWWIAKSRLALYLKWVQKRFALAQQSQVQRDPREGSDPAMAWMGEIVPAPVSERLASTVYTAYQGMLGLLSERGVPVIIASAAFFDDYRQMFQRLSRAYDVPVLELPRLFPEVNSIAELKFQFGLGWNDHLNGVAHDRYAKGIAEVIEKHGYISPVSD